MMCGMKNETWLTWNQWVWNNALENFEQYGVAARGVSTGMPMPKRADGDSTAKGFQLSLLQTND